MLFTFQQSLWTFQQKKKKEGKKNLQNKDYISGNINQLTRNPAPILSPLGSLCCQCVNKQFAGKSMKRQNAVL